MKMMTMDLTTAIYGRRAVRAYTAEPVNQETNDDAQAAEDCCLAAQNLMLAAHAAGLGTCPIGFSRPWLRLPETKQELGIDARYVPVFPVVIGHPAEYPSAPRRRKPVVITSRV